MLSIDIEGMDADQIKRFALFLYEENQTKRTQLDEMIARLDEIGKDLKDVKRENVSLLKALLEANSKAEKVVLEYKLRDKEYSNHTIFRLDTHRNLTYLCAVTFNNNDYGKSYYVCKQ